ncbi:MAG: hypothetical protein KFB93_02855 [Simkaniaceae bacterium]|nr:MAG: hypothetical protein KFB93_02855 [Simkaniaceae bacterium]
MKSRKLLHLFLLTLFCFSSSLLHTAPKSDKSFEEKTTPDATLIPPETGEGYTINFDNVPILELIKFISKIGNVNFIYDQEDLNFNVTIVSEEPTGLVHVMGAFIQVLRLNGLDLIEQGNNLVISKGSGVRQIATVVSAEVPLEGNSIPPIMTRVFRVKNANPATLAGLIGPLLSSNAIIEVSETTRHIIVTDITQNIEEIHKLFYSLDIPKSSLEIDSYSARNNSPDNLIALANQILIPISEGNPLIFVPQASTNTIFVVSTPFLIEKSIATLEDLDSPPSLARGIRGPISSDNILIYHIKNKPADVLQSAIKDIEQNLTQMGPSAQNLVLAINSMKFVKQSHSLLFTGDAQSLSEVKTLLTSLDVPYSEEELEYIRGGFYIYKIKYGDEEQIARSLQKLVQNLKKAPYPDNDLIEAIETMKWIKENDSLMFTGDQRSLNRLKQILPTFDISKHDVSKVPLNNDFFIYTPKNESPDELLKQIQETYTSLKNSNLSDAAFLKALNSAKISTAQGTITFTGDSESLNRIRALVSMLDQQSGPSPEKMSTYIYRIQFVDPDMIEAGLKKIASSIPSDEGLGQTIDNMKYISQSNSFVFRGPVDAVNQIKGILPSLDNAEIASESKPTYFVYALQNVQGSIVLKQLDQTAKSIKGSGADDKALIDSIHNIKWIQSSNSLVITGPSHVIDRIRSIIAKYDDARSAQPTSSAFYVYKPTGETPKEFKNKVVSAAEEMEAAGLDDPALINTLKSATLVSSDTAVMFTGTPEGINKLKDVLTTFDTSKGPEKSEFYIYKPTSVTAEKLIESIKRSATQLQNSGLKDPDLINAMESARLTEDKTRVIFTGTPSAIEKVKVMARSYDNQEKESQASQYYIFKPQNQPPQAVIKQAKHAADQMQDSGLADSNLIAALNSATVVSNGTSVLFTGTQDAINRIKQIASTFDTPTEQEAKTTQYYIFKPQHQSPEAIIKQASHAADEMKDQGLKDPNLIAALNSASVVSKGTGVLFTGTQNAISRVKEIVATFDIPVESTPQANEFYVYKPVHISADDLRRHARMVADDMESSGFADKSLISTLKNTRLVSNGKSVLFTGTETSIAKVQGLLPSLDTPSEDQVKQVGKTTFVIYKIKYLTGPALMGYLRNMASDLKRAGSTQDDLITTLNNMRYVQDTNSIIFTGPPSAVQEAIGLAQKFDIPGLAKEAPARSPSGYQIYKPKFVPGEELIKILRDFEQNLMTSGVTDKELFDVINNLKWMEKTSTILVSGDEADTKKVYGLLERFDIPGPGIPDGEPGIETVSDMSFLIYKLQYHSGAEIQDAIKLIGTDLGKAKTKVNDNLVDAINTLQWIEVTNSLIATGQADALGKLKELIKSIDIPLKQVFVEILVIETTMSNNLQFGLRWGSQGQYRNKFAYGTGVFPETIGGVPDPLISFQQDLSNITAKTTPTGSFIPFTSGGDLGVIGDIILHKGQSYFALGSLMNAIRDEGDSIIVMNQKIITQDNKMSTIFVGQNIPYTGSLVTNQSQTTTTTANLEYRDVGVSLSITPVVGNSDVITLMIEEDISEQQNQADSGSSVSNVQVQGITTNKSSTKTVVSVPDKSFLVLSGSMQDSKTYHRTGVPCLGGLPLIGAAFSDNEKNENISNLVIFVRPHIIKSFDTYQEITERQEDLFRSQTNAEDFDAGLEIVKTPDDSY